MKYRDISQIHQGIEFPGVNGPFVEGIYCAHNFFARVMITQHIHQDKLIYDLESSQVVISFIYNLVGG